MPYYDFRCQQCGATQEEYRPFDLSDHPGKCKKCGGPAERVFSFNGVFKGLSTPGSAMSKNKEEKP
jgi:putative FmdB family regulatory protein